MSSLSSPSQTVSCCAVINFLHKNCFNLSWDACKFQEKLKTMLM